MAALRPFNRILSGVRPMGCRAINTGGDIEIPKNVSEINEAHKAQFSENRTRDIGSRRAAVTSRWVEEDTTSEAVEKADKQHLDGYDNRGALSLKSVMQTNVPNPYTTDGRKSVPTNLNMPGGHINQSYKYEALERQDTHPTRLGGSSRSTPKGRSRVACLLHGVLLPLSYQRTAASCSGTFLHRKPLRAAPPPHGSFPRTLTYSTGLRCSYHTMQMPMQAIGNAQQWVVATQRFSTESSKPQEQNKPLTSGQKLKQAVRDYGSTVIVFHVAISLASLGFFYVAVSSGVDMVSLLERVGIGDSILGKGAVAGASTFVVAYAVHKVFAPVRIACTLTVTPLLVGYLRRKGVLKPPKATSDKK